MRVTESLMYNLLTNDVNTSSSNYATLQQELATGKQINQASDNPAGASQAMSIRGILVDINQYQTNINNATGFMQYTSSTLNSAQELVQQARTIAVAAANGGTMDATQQSADVSQIQSILSQLVNTANSQYNGQYVFSGQKVNTAPYTQGDPTFTYNGDTNAMNSTIGANDTMQINVPGSQVFGAQFAALTQLQTDITAGNYSAISNTDLPAIDSALSTINNTQASLGSNISYLQNTASALTTTQASYQSSLASIEDVNIATVYTQLQSAQNVYQASLIATSKAMQYTLAQYVQ